MTSVNCSTTVMKAVLFNFLTCKCNLHLQDLAKSPHKSNSTVFQMTMFNV